MNYRHAFHAGNFADLFKHAVLTALIGVLKADKTPIQVLDTHAGAGVYDLGSDMARKSAEAQAGVVRLMAEAAPPAVFEPLKGAVRALNPKGDLRFYPGSPVLAAGLLRRGDSYLGCELRPDDHGLLTQALAPYKAATAVLGDGFEAAAKPAPAGARRLLLIDPPFEAADDYARIIRAVGAALKADRRTVAAIWLPLKDLDTLDRFVSGLEDLRPGRTLIAEARLKPLSDPLSLNGCVMVVIGAPPAAEPLIEPACRWTAETLGGAGAQARIWRVGV